MRHAIPTILRHHLKYLKHFRVSMAWSMQLAARDHIQGGGAEFPPKTVSHFSVQFLAKLLVKTSLLKMSR